MKLIIDIPDNDFRHIKEYYEKNDTVEATYSYIYHGIPLPNTFDLEGLKSDMKALNCGFPYGLDYLLDCLKKRLGITITEADKENG
jgi:hypothetical protein